jgi:hypothetical protein
MFISAYGIVVVASTGKAVAPYVALPNVSEEVGDDIVELLCLEIERFAGALLLFE